MRPNLINPPAPPPEPARPLRFGPVFWMVALGHGLALLLLFLWTFFRPAAEPVTTSAGAPMELIELPGPPVQAKAAAPAPPAPPPPPEAAAPVPPPPVETPAPAPPPAPSEIVLPPKPAPAPAPPKAVAKTPIPIPPHPPAPPVSAPKAAPHHPQVSLTEVSRAPSAKTAKSAPAHAGIPGTPAVRGAHAAASSGGAALTSGSVASRLGAALAASGAAAPVEVGSGSGGPAGDPGYYDLIRQQMYASWDQPAELAGRSLHAKIEINVEKDGTVTQASLLSGSGNAVFDQSALAAARRVGKISRPRPDSVPERVIIHFQLTE